MHSTKDRIEEFFKGSVWQDIKEVLLNSIETGRDFLEGTDLSLESIQFNRGSLSQLRKTLDIESTLLDNLEIEAATSVAKENEDEG